MKARTAKRIASSVYACSLALCAGGVALLVASRDAKVTLDFSFRGSFVIISATLATVGWLIARHRSDNAIGWIFSFAGFVGAILVAAEQYGVYATVYRPGSLPAGDIVDWFGSLLYPVSLGSLIVYGFLLFPDGRLPHGHWRLAAFLGPIGIVMMVLPLAIRPGPVDSIAAATNPFGIGGAGDSYNKLVGTGGMVLAAASLGAVTSLVSRMRRSVGVGRQQIKWLVYAAIFVPILLPVGGMLAADRWPGKVVQTAVIVAIAGVPVGAAIGILRYRLYEIDRIISRSLAYAVLSVVLAGGYVMLVFLFGLVFRPLTGSSDLSVAASTLAVAALFGPARRRVQGFTDRRFNRTRYDAVQTIDTFSMRLRSEIDLVSLDAELRGVVSQTMQPARVSLWLRRA